LSHQASKFLLVLSKTGETSASNTRDHEMESHPAAQGNTIIYRVAGQLSYINALNHVLRVKKIAIQQTSIQYAILALQSLVFIDLDGVDALKEMIEVLEKKRIQVVIAGANSRQVKDALEEHDFYNEMKEKGRVFSSWREALNFLHPENKDPAKNEVLLV